MNSVYNNYAGTAFRTSPAVFLKCKGARMKIISSVTLLVISTMAVAESTWSVEIETEVDWLYGLRDCAVLSNGNSVISITGPFEDPFLICFDHEGEILWSRHVLKGASSRAFESNGELVTLEDGFAACYHSEPRATGIDTDVAVVRMNSSGEILWTYIAARDSSSSEDSYSNSARMADLNG